MQAAILSYVYSKCKKYEENGFGVGNCIECCSEELKQILGLPYKRQYYAINKLVASGVVSVEHKNGPTSARVIAINYDKAQKYVIDAEQLEKYIIKKLIGYFELEVGPYRNLIYLMKSLLPLLYSCFDL